MYCYRGFSIAYAALSCKGGHGYHILKIRNRIYNAYICTTNHVFEGQMNYNDIP